ncbi:hypothetical protein VTJ83DRAFT_2116 [Remersonia thermophila]|uniref:Myb-like domain-containing protein n=1 Tax=Remersonia thermophila TaxID=72144 RepID=A0ABR4DHU5_9PEZI
MLLPSALPCDSSHAPPLTRLQAALFASPPASPPQLSAQTAFGSLFSTCRSLQSLLNNPAPAPTAAQQPPPQQQEPITPPLAHAQPPRKLRLRSRKADTTSATLGDHGVARKRVVKRTAAVAHQQHQPPSARSANKRRRAVETDSHAANHNNDDQSHPDSDAENRRELPGQDRHPAAPHTPKCSRIAPEVLPLGLERADYHSLHSSFSSSFSSSSDDEGETQPPTFLLDNSHSHGHYHTRTSSRSSHPHPGTDVVVETDGELWSTEEDRILVELVLEKLKLTKSDWQDCARSLGKDRSSVGRRWKTLMVNGDVGLKKGCLRRPRVSGTWR